MPELPEVETVRRGLEKQILGKKIVEITVQKPNLVRNDLNFFMQNLIGNSFKAINRRGKLIYFSFEHSDLSLLVHLKMTGQLIYQTSPQDRVIGGHPYPDPSGELPNKYSHIIIKLEDGSTLFFNDQRQFGYMHLVEPVYLEAVLMRFGIEPGMENFTWKNFQEILKRYPKSILKAFLLDQTRISGLGNIYVDEACFGAQILPMRRVGSLNETEQKKLFEVINDVIARAIKAKGTTFRDYRDHEGKSGNFMDQLNVYGRGGQKCLICKSTLITKTKCAGRGTHFCEICQK